MFANNIMIDKKYLYILGGRLDKFEQKNDNLWNCRCPICGDSQKDKNKTRGYFFEHKQSIMYKCHNCGISLGLSGMLKTYHHDLYKQYRIEQYGNKAPAEAELPVFKKQNKPLNVHDLIKTPSELQPISSLPDTNIAKKYVLSRKIPKEYHSKLFYVEEFKKFCNNQVSGSFRNTAGDEPRLIIPFYDRKGNMFAWQCRDLNNGNPRFKYITIKKNHDDLLVYGMENVDPSKQIIVVEGPIDSMFLPNCIAVAGSSLSKISESKLDLVFAFDNEPRSPEITTLIKKLAEKNKKIVFWPDSIKAKDINDMVLDSMTCDDILAVINNNTLQGAKAKLKLAHWSKV